METLVWKIVGIEKKYAINLLEWEIRLDVYTMHYITSLQSLHPLVVCFSLSLGLLLNSVWHRDYNYQRINGILKAFSGILQVTEGPSYIYSLIIP